MNLLVFLGAGASLALPAAPAAPKGAAPSDTVRQVAIAIIPPGDSTSRRSFDIPSQPVADALADFARQAGVRVTADGSSLRGVRSAAVEGTFASADALRLMLEGTGLSARFLDEHTVSVRSPEADTVHTLSRVVVTATGARRAGYAASRTSSATKTDTPLRDTPQAVTVVTSELIADQAMQGMTDVVRYTPGVTMGQGEGHRDAPTIRGNASTADFFVDGVRDDAQFLRDLYNTDRVETLKGPNAMIFGRGGGGGVINRVLKDAQWVPVHSATVQGGSNDHKRIALDMGQGLGRTTAVRFNGMYENSGTFREQSRLERLGINPTVAFAAGARTTLRMGYEHFRDDRTVDRGLPSFRGAPAVGAGNRFFGNPDSSLSVVRVNSATAMLEHRLAAATTIRNRTQLAQYDKSYQNIYPGSLSADGSQVSLSAYRASHDRTNLFNQTDLTTSLATGPVMHTLLAGAEVGRQDTRNERNSGFFNNTTASISVPFSDPVNYTPVTFRATATDANNDVRADVAGVYVQDQLALTPKWQLIGGVRYDRFALTFEDHGNALRAGRTLERTDEMLSPRAGLVFKPVQPVSLYSSYGVSYLPSAGDQFASLTPTSQALEPEQFRNAEVGAKWDVLPQLTLTAAAYRLDRTNTSAPDPSNPAVLVQTGSQRTTGHELGITGTPTEKWQLSGGYANQVARIRSTTTAAPAGRTVPLVPRQTASLWNRYQFLRSVGAGLGVIHQSAMYAAIDNTVRLPGFTRLDGALFLSLGHDVRAQLNVENLLNERYYPTSHGNNNIMPGATRTARVSVMTGF